MWPSRYLYPLAWASGTFALDINPSDPASLGSSAATLAYNVLATYVANASGTAPYVVGTLPQPLYWWHAGATWGAMIDHWAYTGDTSYNPSITQALIAQVGPNQDLMPPEYRGSMGNDDIAFWAFAALSALEYGLPYPNDTTAPPNLSGWLQLSQRVFDGMASRWDTGTCNGGLRWQVPPENAGYDYKNSISNGGFFQIASRLYHYTGNTTYLTWASKIWDWTAGINLIDANTYAIYDGSDSTLNCSEADHTQWTYNSAVLLAGTAYLYNATAGDSLWGDRALNILAQANVSFFSPFANSSGVVYESACELRLPTTGAENGAEGGCDNDQLTFKGYMGRWLGKSAVLAPFLREFIVPLLSASAAGAGVACAGYVPPANPAAAQPSGESVIAGVGVNGSICSQHFYTSAETVDTLSREGYFATLTEGQKLGHHLSALEVVQAGIPLVDGRSEGEGGPRTIRVGPGVTIQPAPATSAVLPHRITARSDSGNPMEGGSSAREVGWTWGVGAAALVFGMIL